MSSIDSSYGLFSTNYDNYCSSLATQDYPNGSLEDQEMEWAQQGVNKQMSDDNKQQEKVNKQTEAVINGS
ncbi:MAG: hypothetical protein Q8L98_04750 [Chlamydiales bacterium]|nr:hypothetical protein [Chlamydiales bacterium]